nr:MAG TPA: hypothetical protein [Bacteriophage sp.]
MTFIRIYSKIKLPHITRTSSIYYFFYRTFSSR